MARRGFRIHSRALYDPFNYQELMAPIDRYQTAYNQMQDNMLSLGEEANQYRQLIDADAYASNAVKGYNDALAAMSDSLAREGLKAVNRNTLIGLRRKYNTEVKPINDAAKTLTELQNMYKQVYAKDPKMMRSAMPTIQQLVENPSAMPHMVSGDDLYKQGVQAATAASSRIYDSSFNERANGYIKQIQERGFRPEIVEAFIRDASSVPQLAGDIQRIKDMYKTSALEDGGLQADKYIVQGIIDGMGYSRQENFVQDWQARAADSYNKELKLAQKKHDMKMEELGMKGVKGASGTNYINQDKNIVAYENGKVVGRYINADKLMSDGKDYFSRANIPIAVKDMDYNDKALALQHIGFSVPDDWKDASGNINFNKHITDANGKETDTTVKQLIDYYIDENSDLLNSYSWSVSKEMTKSDYKDATGRKGVLGMFSGYNNSNYKGNHTLIASPNAVIRNTGGIYGDAEDDLALLRQLWALSDDEGGVTGGSEVIDEQYVPE